MSIKVLGLDLGISSIGFSLLNVDEKNNTFDEIVSNSIIFPEYIKAADRRNARSQRRQHERKSRRNERVRRLFVKYKIADKDIIKNPTHFFNDVKTSKTPYELREKAVLGKRLTKDEFVLSLYSICTRRGYSNQFKVGEDDEDGIINEAISKNKKLAKNHTLPSGVLVERKKELEKQGFQNIAIRNKGTSYNNSLDRELWEEEAKKFLESQKENTEIFPNEKTYKQFMKELFEDIKVFEQRPLKSTEDMVGFCSFYDKFHPNFKGRRMPKANILNIELTLRQRIDNSDVIDRKSGEIYELSKEEKDKIVEFWLKKPNVQKITTKNIIKKAIKKDMILQIGENQDDTVLEIGLHKNILDILKSSNIDIFEKNFKFYSNVLNILHNYANTNQKINKIKETNKENLLSEDEISQLANTPKGSGSMYASFSSKFAKEVLGKMRKGENFHEATDSLGYNAKYLGMKPYEYLPPLEPSKNDIKWLKKNVKGFKQNHIFYQPLISPHVKRIISILRKLINDLIKKYGKIDKIVIETSRDLNSDRDKDRIKKVQDRNKQAIGEAEKKLTSNGHKATSLNIERARLFIEQRCKCLYSNEPLTLEEALSENITEVEHFIPRSKIWINSYKNKILVLKSENQNKSSQSPIEFLGNRWDSFVGRVEETLTNKQKIKWLTDKEVIKSVLKNEKLEDRFLNDTRSATTIVANYLEHYLFPKQNKHRKDESVNVFRVTGKAIHMLKRIWGIDKVQPKNEDYKKDRQTNYHHTIDAIVIALLNNSSKNAINKYFKQKESKVNKKIFQNVPKTSKGESLQSFIKEKVKKYEDDKLHVCFQTKQKSNIKGFKDGNVKLIVKNDEILELEKIDIGVGLLMKKQGQNEEKTDKAVKEEFSKIISRLDENRQANIIEALKIYEKHLLTSRAKIKELNRNLKKMKDEIPRGEVKKTTDILELEKNIAKAEEDKNKPCFFSTKNGKKQIVRALKFQKKGKTSADTIIKTDKKIKNRVARLDGYSLKEAKKDKIPYVVKENKTTLSVDLFDTEEKGQIVGLNYFSGIKNDIAVKINPKKIKYIKDFNKKITIYRGDILKVKNTKKNIAQYVFANGAGSISGTNNKISIEPLNNKNTNQKNNKKALNDKDGNITPNRNTIVKKVKIDYYGNISED